jgi:outer membrane protein assembly factor BamD
MNRRFRLFLLFALFVALLPFRSPAPLIYTPGEGWYYEQFGINTKWLRDRAKDQLDVAEDAFKNGDYATASHAAHRVVRVWPLSDYAPRAQYLIGRCLEAQGKTEEAFAAYQDIIKKYPKLDNLNDVLWRQYEIANLYLGGKFFKAFWGTIPLYPSMDDTAKMYSQIVTNGPFSKVAPLAQLRIGAAREKQKDYPTAVRAYDFAADRYYDQPDIVADAMYQRGYCFQKQAASAEYDQGTAAQAIAAYTDLKTLFPDDKRVPEADKAVAALKAEQVRSSYVIAQFYEDSKTLSAEQRRDGAIVYYNEVLQLDPNSIYAAQAKQRIAVLKPQLQIPPIR